MKGEIIMKKKSYFTSDFVDLCAYIALILSGGLLLINFILGLFKANLGLLQNILLLVRDIAFLVGVGLAAYKFTKGKSKLYMILFWIAAIVYIVFAALGYFL